jgi:hypothetical protein
VNSLFHIRIFSMAFLIFLSGCGGGDTTCASFRYQEDAQANYAKHLDRDNDGIACEDLPHRPSGTNTPSNGNSGTTTNPTPTVISSLSFIDSLARSPRVDIMSDGSYRLSASAFYTPLAESYQTGLQRPNNVLALSPAGFSYFSISQGIYLSRFQQSFAVSEGIAFAHAGILKSSLAGDYILLGRRCTSDTNDQCTLVSGTARIGPNGKFDFCHQESYSETCASKISYQIEAQTGPAIQFVFTPSAFKFGSLRAASSLSNTVAVTMNIGTDVYSMFGQPIPRTRILNSGSYVLTNLSPDGFLVSNQTIINAAPHPTIPGISINNNGEQFLLSDIGLLIAAKRTESTAKFSISFQKVVE